MTRPRRAAPHGPTLTRRRAGPWAMAALLLGTGCASTGVSNESVWVCRTTPCEAPALERAGRDEWVGDTKVHLMTVRGLAALTFGLDDRATVEAAVLTDCNGRSVAIPEAQIVAPGRHQLAGGTAWAVMLTPAELATLDPDCGLMVLDVRATAGRRSEDHHFDLSHHPQVGWVSEEGVGPHDPLWPPR